MADECTDVTTIEDLTICCHWVESGVPEEHFIEILSLKKANAENIYSALVKYCRKKNIQLGRLIGMGFMELLLSLVTNVLQLVSVQAANATPGIKHVYTNLMTL